MLTLEQNYQSILEKIDQARKLAPVLAEPTLSKQSWTLIAVSKGQSVDAIEKLYRSGHRDFGENYVQELLKKDEELQRRGCSDIRWHFIGHLQTNKIKAVISRVFCIHTIDSERTAYEVDKRWKALGRPQPLPVFIEVNLAEESSKYGLTPDQVQEFAEILKQNYSGLQMEGLMCIPPAQGDARHYFRQLRELELKCHPVSGGQLSMGMSSDYEIAAEEGATHLRVGTALFGART